VKIHEDSWKQVESFKNWVDLWSTNLYKAGFVIHDTKQIQIRGLRVDTNLKKSGFMINDSKQIHGYTIPWYDSHNLKNYSCHALECWKKEQNRNIDLWPHFMSWVFVNFRASRQLKLFCKCEISLRLKRNIPEKCTTSSARSNLKSAEILCLPKLRRNFLLDLEVS
jgi:hypothetical protein